MQTVPRRRGSPQSTPPPRRRRDRRGRGVRGGLAPRGVPLNRSPSEAFDELVLNAIDELEQHWPAELSDIEFAVEDVPCGGGGPVEFEEGVIADRGVPLGRLYRDGVDNVAGPVIVVYRRPVEARAFDRDDCGDLVFMVVAELVAEMLGRDIDDIDPPER